MNRDLFAAAGAGSTGTPDTYFKNTVLLLSGDGTNGAQNNTILDSSSNNLTMTRGGAISQGSVSPFSKTGWSLYSPTWGLMYTYQDNSGGWDDGNQAFCVEFWLNHVNSTVDVLMAQYSSSNWQVLIRSNQFVWVQNDVNITVTGTLPTNQWNHYAVSRSGGFLSIYVNGVRQYYAANTFDYSYTNGTRYIGAITGSFGAVAMSNLRVVYTDSPYTGFGSTITVPTTPLTAINSTVLLTCQNNRMRDNSSNNYTITLANATNPIIQPVSPFAPASTYSSATDGGSLYFNPNSNTNAVYQDFLTTPANAALTLGTGNFTLEFWIYRNTTASTTVLLDSSTINYLGFSITATQLIPSITTNATFPITYSIINNSWNHIALVRAGTGTNQTTLYVNGTAVGTTTIATDFSASTGTVIIGKSNTNTNYMNGYISNLRLVKGTAVYTGNFTTPTAPLTAISGTSLLLSGTNGGIIDSSTKFNPVTQGDTKISTAIVKYGASSMIFDGTGDFLTIPTSSILQFGTGPFTVEFWMYPTNVTGGRGIFGLHIIGSTSSLAIRINSGKMSYWFSNSTPVNTGTATTIVTNQWYHIAFVRTADATNNIRLYINGVSEAGLTITNTSHSIPTLAGVIGRSYYDNDTEYFIGYLDDLRVTKGVARYTADFTPPTTPFAAF
jgi:hypothetical protein